MRRLIAIAWSLLLFGAMMGGTALAQSSGSVSAQLLTGNYLGSAPQWGYGNNIPSGSYQQTCRDIRNDGNRLEATCQSRNGDWRPTSIDYRGCDGEIVNDDGNLRCNGDNRGGGWGYGNNGYGYGVPQGSYQQTCRDIRQNGDRLEATCEKRNGGWRTTSIDYRGCRGEIVNDDGHLRCGNNGYGSGYGRGGWQGGLPRGTYQQTCQDIRMNGNRLEAR